MITLFFKMVYEKWTPIALLDKKYKMYGSVKFVCDAPEAMGND